MIAPARLPSTRSRDFHANSTFTIRNSSIIGAFLAFGWSRKADRDVYIHAREATTLGIDDHGLDDQWASILRGRFLHNRLARDRRSGRGQGG